MARVRTLQPDLAALRRSLRKLQQGLDRLAAKARRLELIAPLNGSPPGPRRKLTLTPARRSQLKLQGQYMGTMRQLSPAQKARVRAIKEKSVQRAAIAAARAMRKRGR